jgi:hypothetical protein
MRRTAHTRIERPEGWVAVTSIVRHAAASEHSSFLTVVDIGTERIVGRFAIPETSMREHDRNPRGGIRGARGIAIGEDSWAVATADRIYVLNLAGGLVREISHPLAGGIHDLCPAAAGVWVAATASNSALLFSWDGQLLDSWHWCLDEGIRESFDLPRGLAPDPFLDYRVPSAGIGQYDITHLNSVYAAGTQLLVSLGHILPHAAIRQLRRRSRIARYGDRHRLTSSLVAKARHRRESRLLEASLPAPERKGGTYAVVSVPLEAGRISRAPSSVVWQDARVKTPKHNLLLANGALLYTDSDRGLLVTVDVADRRELRTVAIPGSPPFARGLCAVGDAYVVGSQRPLSLSIVSQGHVTGSIVLPGHEWETSYAVGYLPPTHRNVLDELTDWAEQVPF